MPTSRRKFLTAGLAGTSLAWNRPRPIGETGSNPEAQPSGSAALRKLLGRLRLGAEFFLNKDATEEDVTRHFRLMQSHGLTIARIFIIWDDIERAPGQWNFERYDWIYSAAQASGIKIAATLCAEDPPGWMKLTPFYHSHMNLNDPNLRQQAARYLREVVGRYRRHAAQGAWLLMNEPHPEYYFDRSTMDAFGRWLQAKYGTVEKLNKRWFRPLEKFSHVQVSPEQWNSYWVDYGSFVDWHEFNDQNLVEILLWVESQIRKMDSVHPTHINPTGGNFWKLSKTVDFIGASIHPAWLFSDFKREEFGLAFAYYVDVLASVGGGKPWWVTELQGGPTIYTGRRAMNPTKEELTLWLWDAFGAGARGVVFWLWNPRALGREGGEWQMVSLRGTPSERASDAKSVAEAISRMPFLADATPEPPNAAILYNREALLLLEIDGRPQDRTREAAWSLIGCYEALHRKHVPVTFIDIDELKSGSARRYQVLYAPYCYAIDDDAVSALRQFVQNGGTFWADGLLAWKNEYGTIRPSLPGGLSEVFGWESYVEEVDPTEEPYSVTAGNEAGGELWKIPLRLRGAQVLVTDRRGRPFATEHRFGRGKAIYYGAAVTLAYFRRSNATVQGWITAPALYGSTAGVQLTRGSDRISFRALRHASGPIAVITNWGPDSKVEVEFRGEYASVTNALSNSPVTLTRRGQVTLAGLILPSRTACVLKASRSAGRKRSFEHEA